MLERIDSLRAEAAAAIAAAGDTDELEQLRVRYLGRKSELTSILRGIADLPAAERGPVGSGANGARQALEAELEAREAELEAAELETALAAGAIDVTMPGAPPAPEAAQSLLVRTQREIEDVFTGLGYRVVEGPEVELDYYNFTALNHPPGHPARMAQDTFYVDPATLAPGLELDGLAPGPEDVVLRTHTSPMQVRSMEAQEPPIMIVCPGRCYRSDPFDATHSPMFHQVEGLAVGEDITLADLKGTLDEFARAIFGPGRETRFRPGFFPFTEPSVEVDVSCFRCGGSGVLADGSRDPLCKGVGWIEILGSGMVDPNVYGFVREHGYDPERVQGFAFGMGVERIAMLKHGIPDLRKFFENDVRVLRQFRVKVPYSWLREYCDPGLSPEEIGATLSMHSIELERISHLGAPSAEGFVVGRVVSAEPHPNADRLRVCEVDTGDGTRTIVCGAPNVAAEQSVAVVVPGARMPGGEQLKKAKLRGIESNGMILSERELELGEDHDGILVLPPATSSASRPGVAGSGEEWAPGTPLAEVFAVSEPVIELEPTSNRVDCFGVYGVARELHAVTGAELAPAPWEGDAEATGEGAVDDYASVTVEVPELCPRFSARVFTDVTIGPSPPWLKARLSAAGMRPINNVVDITNYVMLMTAQPLHAFDLDRVPGGEIIVRTARAGETMTTLDGNERRFDDDAVLVCDRDGPTGVAGIMGGLVSEVSDSTTRVLLEVATWDGVNILRTSRKLGLRSDASNRNEKQLHPELALRAQRIASRLMVELCGARLVPGTIDVTGEIPEPRQLRLRDGRAERLLGLAIPRSEQVTYLRRLGFEVGDDAGALAAEVPVHRHYDVTREADLIEEVGRIHGYAEHLPATLPALAGRGGGLSREQRLRRRAEDLARDLGFDGVVTLSLTDPAQAAKLRLDAGDPRAQPIGISNPLSGDHSALRTTLVAGLLDVAAYNLAHGARRVAVYESGRVYLRSGKALDETTLGGSFPGRLSSPAFEPWRLGALASGPLPGGGWRGEAVPADFYALKGVLEGLAAGLGVELEVEPAPEPFLSPGRAGRVLIAGAPVGWIGELHPLVCGAWGLEGATGFELDLAPLVDASPVGREQYEDVITYPAVEQDLAVIVAEEVAASSVRGVVAQAGGELLRSIAVFDVYRGEQVGEDHKSLALRLEFRAADRTLTDDEVAAIRVEIEAALGERLGGRLRG